MTLYTRVGGIYQVVDRPYVRVGGVYTGAKEAFVRISGTYRSVYLYDVTPPDPPELTLELIEHRNNKGVLTGRYIKVGVRLPGVSNDADARLTRVLTTYQGEAPTTQFGGNYIEKSDETYPNEPWSEWRYNSYGAHKDTSVLVYKQWPPNSTATTDIESDKTYYFTGWSLDNNGNWSAKTAASIKVPKASVEVDNLVVKEATIQANTSGSWKSGAAGYQSGQLLQQNNPRSRGLWFYGSQFNNSVGKNGAPTIRNAQIWIKREDDAGVANCDVHLFWTKYGQVGDLPAPGSGLEMFNNQKIGTLAKGQGKWFDLPSEFYADLDKNLKGMGLDYKNFHKASAGPEDFSVMKSTGENLRSGEVHVVWEEKP